ncbi:carbohydrate kinase family protein [Nonomuraea sp. 3N208]|uniref:carbohydrate kinase family protein n=1 Tax=Nonomuraea sp. 3N208 TaxID=3457421 RepID=UPI003FD17C3B
MVDLLIVGHVGTNDETSPHGRKLSPGGAGYGSARGATLLAPEQVGLVSALGLDYDLEPLRKLGIDTRGVALLNGPSARFRIIQYADGRRSVDADLGVASQVTLSSFPMEYRNARHAHICTAPPSQQLQWLEFLRGLPGRRTISVDAFELYAKTDPERSRVVVAESDLAFMNDEERQILFGAGPLPDVPIVVKHGPRGASYVEDGQVCPVATCRVTAVDTTHAGEILAGVFLALRMAAVDAVTALQYAVRAATAKVTQFGVDGDRLLESLSQIRAEVRAEAISCSNTE